MNTYQFVCNNKTKTFIATSLKNAEEKGALILEELNDNLDLLGLSWEEIQDECTNYNITVSDLTEILE